jgi:hypothetical protein
LKLNRYIQAALSIVAAVLVIGTATWESFYKDTLSSSFFAVALLSLLLILMRVEFAWKQLLGVVVFAALLAGLDLRFLDYKSTWPVWASFVGLSSFFLMLLRLIWYEEEKRRLALYTVIPAFLFLASEWCADIFLAWTQHAQPRVLDLYLYSFDASMHVQIPFVVGRLFEKSFAFAMTSMLVYIGLPMAIGLCYAGCLKNDRKNALPAFVALLITGPLGAIFYNFFPAMGPVHIFKGDFPFHPLATAQVARLQLETVTGDGARNAIPSLHAAWAFLVVWYSRRLSLPERMIAAGFLVFTLCATMGSGEHYFIDLVVAVPFSLLVVAVSHLLLGPARQRYVAALAAGLGMTVIWLVVLRQVPRFFWISPLIPWAACLLTVAAAGLCVRLTDAGTARTREDGKPSLAKHIVDATVVLD